MTPIVEHDVVIIGGGPGGLLASQSLASDSLDVHLYERNPWIGRKFLVAGKSGLNLTHTHKTGTEFLDHYLPRADHLVQSLQEFSPVEVREWALSLGINTFIGSSGKVFPEGMKAAPLLAAWKQKLDALKVNFHFRHKFTAIDLEHKTVQFATPNGVERVKFKTILFALGGGSWPMTGSTGEWVDIFTKANISCAPLRPANMGFDVAWSDHLVSTFEGVPIKTVSLSFVGPKGQTISRLGEFVITRYGVEGNLIYALSATIRDLIEANGPLRLELNLMPNSSTKWITDKLSSTDPKRSFSTNLTRALGLPKEKIALLWEAKPDLNKLSPTEVAEHITHLPITFLRPRSIEEAISSAGGIKFDQLDEYFMAKNHPSVFFAGEMLDWEAPTGGYLLNGVMASGLRAAKGMKLYLKNQWE